jgi:hypothetical protein
VKSALLATAGLAVVILGVVLLQPPGPGNSARAPEDTPTRRPAAPAPSADPDLPWGARDPFRYVEPAPVRTVALPTLPTATPTPVPPPSASPLRVIGIVHKSGAVKAAISMWGETVVLGVGEESRGYRVLSIDEESGVRLKAPEGSELTLPPSSF